VGAAAAEDRVYITVAYCPGYFDGKGAVVQVDHKGHFDIVGKFALPSEILGCPMNEAANYHADVKVRTDADGRRQPQPFDGRNTHLSFGTEFGQIWVVDQDSGRLALKMDASSTDGSLFDGFTNFAITSDATTYRGLTPHVTQNGFCGSGCFRFGHQDIATGAFTGFGPLPFRSVMSDTKLHHEAAGMYYAQGSYPLAEEARCSGDDTDQCMFAVNATTGKLVSSKRTSKWVAYKYEDMLQGVSQDGTVLAWVFHEDCGNDLNSFAFARVHLETASAELISCISKDDVVHFNPNMGGFTHDNTRFATASGNPYTGSMQLLVFDVATGKTVLNSDLKGLPEALGVKMDEAPFVAVWGLAHMEVASANAMIV